MYLARIAWRNLWRNKRRTLLTCGALAFAMLLIQVGMSFQAGSYGPMIELGTKFSSGHLQIVHPDVDDFPLIEQTITQPDQLRGELQKLAHIDEIGFRVETFALINHGEKSFGALVVGVEPSIEPQISLLPNHILGGQYLPTYNEAYIGSALARNLDVTIGDELVILGSDRLGSVAATIVLVGGIFESGNTELDRTIVHVPIELFNEVFEMSDAIHRVVIMVSNPLAMKGVERDINHLLKPDQKLRNWQELMPEINESITLDRISNGIVYGVLIVIVVLSIANTFTMTMFERTREFGILRALGMQNPSIFAMFSFESFFMWLVGSTIGLGLSLAVILPLSKYGIALSSTTMEELVGQFFLPDRIYASIDLQVLIVAPIALGIGIVLSSCLAGTRLYRVPLLNALRFRE
ncbi:MAG: ABC transporter permease [Gammaproteobacteria bacterium]|nr:ABC transporter permease [Gammaproteobacteria bacterium]MYF52578.1 ABC transporter permease [Gammaproteobacteria bacterium]MYK44261.1 ABC transporter permease [Gammaproteobacteria bacterium]